MTQTIKTDALVIHGRRWSETSKIVELFTPNVGYLKVLAKGAFRPKSEFRGVLENLNRIEAVVSVRETRGLQIISQVYLIDAYSNIREDLNSTAIAFSILELIRAFVRYNENANRLYGFTVQSFHTLNQEAQPEPMIFLLKFMLFLSEYLGFGWNFDTCHKCGKSPQSFPLKVDPVNGAVICSDCSSGGIPQRFLLDRDEWKFLTQLGTLSPQDVPTLFTNDVPDARFRLLLDMLLLHLNYHTEQRVQLKSLNMYLS